MILHGLDLNYLGINNVWNDDLGMLFHLLKKEGNTY